MFQYDAAKKAPFYNAQSNYQLLGFFIDNIFVNFGGDRDMTEWTSNNLTITQFENTYNAEGYLTATQMSGLLNMHVSFEYTKV